MRSQRHLRYEQGFDVRGTPAYAFGERSRLTLPQQYHAARAEGFSPPLPAGVSLPANTVLPDITGSAVQGQTLGVSTGTWTGTATITYAYQWLRGPAQTPIAGATNPTYVVTALDVGGVLRARLTATNDYGSVVATSAPTGTVTAE